MQPARLDLAHLNLDVRDLDVSERFYRDVLDLPIERSGSKLIAREPGFLIVLNCGEPAMGGTFHFGFRVDSPAEVDAWFARVRDRAPVVREPKAANGVYVGRISDPDGYGIEIYCDLANGDDTALTVR
jgi:catechol-2,3-dioxygenase